jgi:hypothetical protein
VYKTEVFSCVKKTNPSDTDPNPTRETQMPISGAKPSGRPTVNRNKPTYEWTVVTNVAYTGPRPELPLTRQVMVKNGEVVIVPIEDRTREWWDNISTMPHCTLWSKSDWQFALDTAMVHASSVYGSVTAGAELRQRERILGTTFDARRDLRIKYEEPVNEEDATPLGEAGAVVQLKDRRSRLATNGS